MLNPNDVYEKLVGLGESWSDTNAAADLLEETKKPLLAELGTQQDGSMASKESFALQHPDYKQHVKDMVEARRLANRAKVKWESAKIYSDMLRTQNANERAANRSAT